MGLTDRDRTSARRRHALHPHDDDRWWDLHRRPRQPEPAQCPPGHEEEFDAWRTASTTSSSSATNWSRRSSFTRDSSFARWSAAIATSVIGLSAPRLSPPSMLRPPRARLRARPAPSRADGSAVASAPGRRRPTSARLEPRPAARRTRAARDPPSGDRRAGPSVLFGSRSVQCRGELLERGVRRRMTGLLEQLRCLAPEPADCLALRARSGRRRRRSRAAPAPAAPARRRRTSTSRFRASRFAAQADTDGFFSSLIDGVRAASRARSAPG